MTRTLRRTAFSSAVLIAAISIELILTPGCVSTQYRTVADRQLAFQEASNLLSKARSRLEKSRALPDEAERIERESRNDLMRARDIFDRLFEQQRTVTIVLSLAQTQKLLGDIEAAYRSFLYIVNNLDTNHAESLAELGSIALSAFNNGDEAKGYYKRILASDPDNTEALFYTGYIDYRKSDYQSARISFEKLLALPPTGQYRAYAELYLGVVEFYAGNYEQCAALIGPRYAAVANDVEGLMFAIPLYKSCQITERFADALEVIAPLEREASNALYTHETVFLASLAGKPVASYAAAVRAAKATPPSFVLAAFMIEKGDMSNARELLIRDAAGSPPLETMQMLFHIDRKLGPPERARKTELDLAVYYYRNNVYGMALRHLTSLVAEKKYAYLWYDIAMAYLRTNDTEHARDAAARYIKADITHKLAALWDVSDFLLRQRSFPDAQAGYDRIIKLFPDSTFAYLQKGVVYGMTGDAPSARRMIEKARSLFAGEDDKGKKSAYYTIGTIELMIGRSKEAVDALSRALDLDPDDPNSLNALGYTYIDQDINIAKGLTLVKKALSIRQSPHFYDSLGWGYFKEKRFDEAKTELTRALGGFSGEGLSVVYGHLGDVYLAMGDTANALESFRKALAVEEKSIEFNEKAVREKVKKLEGKR
ncbi:MAG: tetratricopeptide repeat protein [Spirochaetota bacterium]